jgi:hypothetical protein
MLNAIATDNDGIADISHEVLHKIYSYAILNYTMAMGVDKRRADGGRRTADGGRRTADDGRRTADDGRRTADDGRRTAEHQYKHMVINVLFHPFEFLEIKFF